VSKTTSKLDFEYFSKKVRYYIKQFGLSDYEIVLIHKDLEDEGEPLSNSTAGVKMNANSKSATFYLNKDWGDGELDRKALERAAIHEVGHILLCDYYWCAATRFGITSEQIGGVEHAIIRRLENFILRT